MKKCLWLTEQDEKFIKDTFGVNFPQLTDKWITHFAGRYVIDVFKLDDLLKREHEYKEGSVRDFIVNKWGEDALAQTMRLSFTFPNYLPIKL